MQPNTVGFSLLLIASIANLNLLRASGVDLFWRDYNGTIPRDALPTGHNTYIGQVIVDNCGNLPGTLYSNNQNVITMVSGRKVVDYTNIMVLCTKEPNRFSWEYVNTNSLRSEYLLACPQGGYEFEPLYIGKIFHENQWKVGKVFPASSKWKGLNVWWGNGSQYIIDDFKVLKFS